METAQSLFDQSVLFLAKQKKVSSTKGQCRYRKTDGSKCALGCLFKRGEYKQDMEGKCVETLRSQGLFPERLLPHYLILKELQFAHDLSNSADELVSYMHRIAEKYQLNGSSVQEISEWKNEAGKITKVTAKQ